MRPLTFTSLLVLLFSITTTAQLSVTPLLGTENTKTTVFYNDLAGNTPLGGQLSPQFALRLDYKFKKQHGLFLGFSTSRSGVSYQFTDPENGMKLFQATPGDMQVRLEGGYQVSSKRFYFGKSGANKSASAVVPSKPAPSRSYSKSTGNNYSGKGHCGRNYNRANVNRSSAATQGTKAKEKGWYMAVQPLIGAAYIPSVNSNLETYTSTTETGYMYNAGNWNTALITGAGLEFGKNVDKKFVIIVQYLKGLGNLDNTQITSMTGAKQTTTFLRSDVSGWSVKAGIPISLSKKKPAVKQVVREQLRKTEKKCGEYKRCSRGI